MAVSKKKSAAANETTMRHVWLAGLGLIAMTRREAIAVPGRVFAGVAQWKRRAGEAVADAQANVRDGIDGVRSQVEPKVVKLSAEVESRLAPVLVKLGLKQRAKAQRKTRKPAAKKIVRRTTARKRAARKTR